MKNIQTSLNNGLYIVATPIGNLQDISARALTILNNSKIIICENPLHSSKLLKEYDIKKKLVSIHDYNEEEVIEKISKYLSKSVISLISDAGSPLISDPGFKLVKFCIKKNIYFTSIPGASSVISALQLSGIPVNSFSFNGFIPKKIKHINELFEITKKTMGAQIFFSSPHRLIDNIKIIEKHFKNKKITICKELTKLNESCIRTTTNKAVEKIKESGIKIRGEFVIIIEGNYDKNSNKINDKTISTLSKISKKFSLTDTVKIVHNLTSLSKKDLYKAALLKIKKRNA